MATKKTTRKAAAKRTTRTKRAASRPCLPKITMQNAAEVRDVAEQTVQQLRDGKLDPQRGYAISSLCRVALEAMQLVPQAPHAQPTPAPEAAAAGTPKKRAAWAPPDLNVVEGAGA